MSAAATAKPSIDADRATQAPLPPAARELLAFVVGATLTVALLSYVFPPNSWWPLGFVALAPWTIATLCVHRAWIVHWGNLIAGWVFFLINLTWLSPVTGPGFVALAAYLAVYWVLTGWAIRTGRRVRLPAVLTLPITWVACEYLRGWVMSGFPWLFIAHGFYQQSLLTQISDITGAYGVSFVAALVSGVIADLWLMRGGGRPRLHWRGAALESAAAVIVVGVVTAYGAYRIGEAPEWEQGPRVAVTQEDYVILNTPPFQDPPEVILPHYLALGAQAAAADKPDLIVFPESAWSTVQNIEFLRAERNRLDAEFWGLQRRGRDSHTAVASLAQGDYAAANRIIERYENTIRYNLKSRPELNLPWSLPRLPNDGGPPAHVLVGATSYEVLPDNSYPRFYRYNSALYYLPDGSQLRRRYDKVHLVPLGEYVPFRNAELWGVNLHPVYRWLNDLSPLSMGGTQEYTLTPGAEFTRFELPVGERTYAFGVPICYEDVMPYVARRFVWDGEAKRADFLVNISNDGWFLHSAELEQHLAICTFRAIENRVSVARSVNTGISAFINPIGQVFHPESAAFVDETGRFCIPDGAAGRMLGPGVKGYAVAAMPLDRRVTLYSQYGDVFAGACLALTCLLWLGAIINRWIQGMTRWFQRWGARRKARRAANAN